MIERLQQAIGLPGVSIYGSNGSCTLSFLAEHTQSQKDAANSVLAAFDWSDAAHLAWLNIQERSKGLGRFDNAQFEGKLWRSVAYTLLDEINSLRQWLVTYKAQIALASTFADMKTRVAGLANMPDRTASQARTAISNKLDSDA